MVKKIKKGGYRKKESKWFHKKMKEIWAKGPTDRGATLLPLNLTTTLEMIGHADRSKKK